MLYLNARLFFRSLPILLCALLVFIGQAPCALAQDDQGDWSARVLKQRKPEDKERVASQIAARQGVPDQTLITLVKRERHGVAVAAAAGQYFEKATAVPESFEAIHAVSNRRDIGAKAVVFAAMSPVSEQLITAMSNSPQEVDRQVAARMLAALAVMHRSEEQMKKDPPADPAQAQPPVQDITPAWLKADHSANLKFMVENSKGRSTLEYAYLAAGLARNPVVRDMATEHQGHRVQEVAFAARFALAALGGEIDSAKLLEDLNNVKRQKAKPPLSYEVRPSPLIYLIMTAGEAKAAEAVDPLLAYVKDRDLHTAVAAVRALGQIGSESVAVRLVQAMDEQTPWPVRIAIYDAVGANPAAAAVPLLTQRFEAETGRLRQDALHALLSIAAGAADGGEPLTIESFKAWWEANNTSFDIDPIATRSWRSENKVGGVDVASFAGFYETAVISDRLVFAIDASKSMSETQVELLQQTLTQVIASFPAESKFNLVDFGGHVRLLAKGRMVTGEVKERALSLFLRETELTFGTRIFEAVEVAMDLPEVDTVHLLSDGGPYASQLNSWQRMDYATRVRCATVPIAVHQIFLAKGGAPAQIAKQVNARQMRAFAESRDGRFQVLVPEVK